MEIERRERDPDTGEIFGEGFGDVFGKIVAKLTGKTAKNLQQKQQKNLLKKELKKLGKKLANLLVKKFMINFQQSVQLTAPVPASQCEPNPQRSAANKRKRNWKNASGEAAPFGRCCEQTSLSRQKQISKDK